MQDLSRAAYIAVFELNGKAYHAEFEFKESDNIGANAAQKLALEWLAESFERGATQQDLWLTSVRRLKWAAERFARLAVETAIDVKELVTA